MKKSVESRRQFLKAAGLASVAVLWSPGSSRGQGEMPGQSAVANGESVAADYTLRIKTSPIELAPNRIVSMTTYNEQFPGPLLRFKEGRQVTVDVHNDSDTPEQLHWHGQKVPSDVDGASEEGTPFIPAHDKRRIVFTPGPAGFRFYHTHTRAGANLSAGQYSGQVGPVYIEPSHDPGRYDREMFLVLKEFEPTFSRGGDMAMDFLSPAARIKALEAAGEAAMKTSLAKGMPHGYEVGYGSFTINGRMLGHGDPIRVKRGERVLFHNHRTRSQPDQQAHLSKLGHVPATRGQTLSCPGMAPKIGGRSKDEKPHSGPHVPPIREGDALGTNSSGTQSHELGRTSRRQQTHETTAYLD